MNKSEFRFGYVIFLAAILFGLQPMATAQRGQFSDGKKLTLASEVEFLRIRELLEDKRYLAAAKAAHGLMSQPPDGMMFLPESNSPGPVLVTPVVRMQIEISNWATDFPQALSFYRALINAEAKTIWRDWTSKQERTAIHQVAYAFFLSEIGDNATNQLATILLEEGRFLHAMELWDSLIRVKDFPVSTLRHYPDSDLSQLDLMANSIFASLFAGLKNRSAQKLRFVVENFSNSQFNVLGRKGLTARQLSRLHAEETRRVDLVDSMQSRIGDPLDIRGSALWRESIKSWSNNRSPYFQSGPLVADLQSHSITTQPAIHDEYAYWSDESRIYRKRITSGKDEKDPGKLEVVWETPFETKALDSKRKRLGKPRFEILIQDQFLFARMGEASTSVRNEALARERSYVVGMDLSRDARLLPGFPISNTTERSEFESTIAFHDNRLYLLKRKSFRDNAVSKLSVECHALSPSNRARTRQPLWSTEIGSGESLNRGIWDEISHAKLLIAGDRLVVVTTGFVFGLDLQSGGIDWVTPYQRDRFLIKPANLETAAPRQRIDCIEKQGKLFVMPDDASFIYCIHLSTGKMYWKAEFPNVVHLLGCTDSELIGQGHQLFWIDLESGRLRGIFPAGSDTESPGFGIPSPRAIGRGVLFRSNIYFPTREKIFVFDSKPRDVGQPDLVRIIDLPSRKLRGGNIVVNDGVLLIADQDSISAFAE